jgi:hypothetical protein
MAEEKTNGDSEPKTERRVRINRNSMLGLEDAIFDLTEMVANGEIGAKEGDTAIKGLGVAASYRKTMLEMLKFTDKASKEAKEKAAELFRTQSAKAIEHKAE